MRAAEPARFRQQRGYQAASVAATDAGTQPFLENGDDTMNGPARIVRLDDFRVTRKQGPEGLLLSHWEAARGGALIPTRSAIVPEALGQLLSSAFLLQREGDSGRPLFRLAGRFVEALAGGKLRGRPFATLFAAGHRVGATLAAAPVLGADVLLHVAVAADGRRGNVVLLPLLDEQGGRTLALGCVLGLPPCACATLAVERIGAQRIVPRMASSGGSPVARFVPA